MRISHLRGLAVPMKCDIAVKHPHGRPWFTAGDLVAGVINLELKKETSITSIVVCLNGRLYVSFVCFPLLFLSAAKIWPGLQEESTLDSSLYVT